MEVPGGTGLRMCDGMVGAASQLQHHIGYSVSSQKLLKCTWPEHARVSTLHYIVDQEGIMSLPVSWIHFFAAFCSFLFLFSCCLHLTPANQSFFFRFLTTLPHLVDKCRPETAFLSMVRVFCHDEPCYALTLWRHKPNLIYCQQQQWGSQPARWSRLITLWLILTLLV